MGFYKVKSLIFMPDLLSTKKHAELSLEIERLTLISKELVLIPELKSKVTFLENQEGIEEFFIKRPVLKKILFSFSDQELYLLYSLIVIQQLEEILQFEDEASLSQIIQIKSMLFDLIEADVFYDQIGGLIGYQANCLKLLRDLEAGKPKTFGEKYFPPKGMDLTKDSEEVDAVVLHGVLSLKQMGEIYPVGGAADRLNLHDEKTHIDLPAARLEFLGRTLLEGMIRDLEAKEYLHYKLFHEQVITPIAMMTSHEKNNDAHIKQIVKESKFFKRPEDSFIFFSQPLVPTFTKSGKWCLKKPLKLLLKPGGHGVIWTLALKKKIFDWFFSKGRQKALIRQINNPIAGTDLGILALTGIGCLEDKSFGFASCPRRVKTSEGMNILKQKPNGDQVSLVLSNIEYCDFEKFGIEDASHSLYEPYSIFPSNTNILFADLPSVQKATKKIPYPGMLVNFKEMPHFEAPSKEVVEGVARLELLMQNIADAFEKESEKSLEEDPNPSLPSFITFNKRNKTISPTKKQFIPGSGLVETAYGCFYDYLKNAYELLTDVCKFHIPKLVKEEEFLEKGPSFLFSYHPALGPLYSVIAQKMQSGFLHYGAEMQLEIADICIQNIALNGSLIIHAENIQGHEENHLLKLSNQTGRCHLKNVRIVNKGIDRSADNIFWRNSIERKESCSIYLQGYSEFYAEDVTLHGDLMITVKDGERLVAKTVNKEVVFKREKIDKTNPKPLWNYRLKDKKIILELN